MSMHRPSGCPSCAEPLEEGDRFCGVCGYALSAPPPPPDHAPTLPDRAPGEGFGAGRAAGGAPGAALGTAGVPAAGRASGGPAGGGNPAAPCGPGRAGDPDPAPGFGGPTGSAYAARVPAPATGGPVGVPGPGARAGTPAHGAPAGGYSGAPARQAGPGFGSAVGVPAPGWEGTPVAPGSASADDTPWGAPAAGSEARGGPHGPAGSTAPAAAYGATPQGARHETPYDGTPQGDPHQAPYATAPEGDRHEAPYGGTPQGDRRETPYDGIPQGDPHQAPYATPQGNRREAPYGTTPQGDPHETPYGTAQHDPHGAPYGTPHGDRRPAPSGGAPRAEAHPDAHDAPQPDPDGAAAQRTPHEDPYGGAPQGTPPEGARTGTPQGSGGGRTCVACRAGYVDTDGYCEHCGHAQPRERDHLEEELCSVAAVSDRGLRHHRNEDSFAVAATALPDGSAATVAIVCDGVSSASRPDDASAAAAGAASEALLDALPRGAHPAEAMHEAILTAGAAVSALAPQPPGAQNAPACTLVGAVVCGGLLTIGWVGDSRAYWIPDDRTTLPRRLTEDDSWAAQMVAAGLMGEAEAYADVRAHAITGWLGADAYELDPHTASFRPDHPGVVVVCTDGLWNYAESAADMARILPPDAADRPLHCAQVLVGHALDGGGHDNITVAVVPFAPPAAEQEAEHEAEPERGPEPEAAAEAGPGAAAERPRPPA
ncbi:protein phosphatase 2C domain-containing protein [Streptomyces sp. NPDC096136]|uniref:protein phosphatase 2C domain-containing protein n=1 Tax=Streptomyces sp. NPDC096136 TaxID=3366076 RepID=UPI00382626B8